MMTRIHGIVQFECDGCADVLDSETKDFGEATLQLRAEGWVARLVGRDWHHYCGGCKQRQGNKR